MLRFILAMLVACTAVLLLCISMGYAATGAPPPMHIDFSPFIPVINDLITAMAGILTLMVPVMVGYAVVWLRNHGIAMKESAQQTIVNRVNATITNGLNFATTAADVGMENLKVEVKDPLVAKAANYVIAQSPGLLKKAGIDPLTEEGQASLVRLVTAKNAAPVVQSLDVNAHVDAGVKG